VGKDRIDSSVCSKGMIEYSTISGHRLALAMAAAVAGPPILAFDATNN
jgi:hypothetical protein